MIFGRCVVSWFLWENKGFDESYTLMVLFFPRLNLCNLSLLPEDYNGGQLQGFQSLQDKGI